MCAYSTYVVRYFSVPYFVNMTHIKVYIACKSIDKLQINIYKKNMVKTDKTKQRGHNFSQEERRYLVERVKEQEDIIECPFKSYKANVAKNEAWKNITYDFCAKFPDRVRSMDQLKDLWKRAKTSAKHEAAAMKQSARKTGGGPPESQSKLSDEAEQVLGALSGKHNAMDNSFDDDAEPAAVSNVNEPSVSNTRVINLTDEGTALENITG